MSAYQLQTTNPTVIQAVMGPAGQDAVVAVCCGAAGGCSRASSRLTSGFEDSDSENL